MTVWGLEVRVDICQIELDVLALQCREDAGDIVGCFDLHQCLDRALADSERAARRR